MDQILRAMVDPLAQTHCHSDPIGGSLLPFVQSAGLVKNLMKVTDSSSTNVLKDYAPFLDFSVANIWKKYNEEHFCVVSSRREYCWEKRTR